jgi:ribosome biogenesis GTPase
MNNEKNKPMIISSISGQYKVKYGDRIFDCKAKGVFRNKGITPFVGDFVKLEGLAEIDKTENSENLENFSDNSNSSLPSPIAPSTSLYSLSSPIFDPIICEIFPRKNSIIRPPVANIDLLIFVLSTCEPSPNFLLLDKFIAIAEYKKITPIIAVTKTDLSDYNKISEVYNKAGIEVFPIVYTENNDTYNDIYNQELNALKQRIKGNLSVFTGNSGVGKSTLINALTGLEIETNQISKKLGRGKHTTRTVQLYPLEYSDNNVTYIADTPGFSTFNISAYDNISKEDLSDCFREFREYKCRFRGCRHIGEPDCGVFNAVLDGEIHKSRYENYKKMQANE